MAEQARLPADVVEYFLFPETPNFLEDGELEEILLRKHDEYLASLSHLLISYIWQNEPFSLKPVLGDVDLPPHLHGRVHFGDNIDDEWFIVYLLLELTKQFPNLIVRVNDNDGEFLLIEAAESLPKWANPESAENRVYIYKGEVHLIPIPECPAEMTSLPLFLSTIRDAVSCVRESPSATLASDDIQTAIHNKLSCFPHKAVVSKHRAHCYVPAALAAILNQKPSLIAPAVQAFYYRDPIDLKACRTFKHFRPGTRVTAQITFTKCLYAQLMQQRFQPDQRSGFVMPSQSAPHFKSYDLGMKLAHGFEILCSKCSNSHVNSNNGSSPKSDLRWKRFVKSLSDKGYFKDEIPGSRLYQQLQESAYTFYTQNVLDQSSNTLSPGEEMLKLLNTVKYDIEAMKRASLPPPDDDSWLDISAEELDEMLMRISGRGEEMNDGHMDIGHIAESMKTFVESVSSHEGAEFPAEVGEGDIQFDSTGFIHAMQKMFEFEDDAKSESGSSMSEYGWETDSDDELASPARKRPDSKQNKPKEPTSTPTKRPTAPPPRPPPPSGRPNVKPPGPPGPSLPGKQKDGRSLEEYMDMMDKELAQTEVGKSFVRESQPVPKPRKKKQVNGATNESRKDIDDEDDDFTPVNIDLNTVKNMLHSYEAQQGLPGPASNILNRMGVKLTDSGRTNGQSKYSPFK